MKLAIIGHQYRLPKHWKLGVELAKQGVEVLMLAPGWWGGETWRPQKGPGWFLITYPVESEGEIFNYTMPIAWNLIQEFRPDWIFSDSEPCAAQSVLSLKWARKLGAKMACYSWENVFKPWRSVVEKKVLRDCDIVFVGNEGARKNLTKKGCSREKIVKVLETGIDTELYKPLKEVEKRYDCLFLGRRVPEKGVQVIDQALGGLPLTTMLWVGKGEYVPKHGEVKGYLPEEDLPAAYNSARLFLYPSIPTNDWQEQGFYSGLEALACGTSVVSTFCGAIPELVGDCRAAYLIQPNSVPLLKAAILKMVRFRNLEEEARNFILEKYSLPVIGEKYLKALKEIEN